MMLKILENISAPKERIKMGVIGAILVMSLITGVSVGKMLAFNENPYIIATTVLFYIFGITIARDVWIAYIEEK